MVGWEGAAIAVVGAAAGVALAPVAAPVMLGAVGFGSSGVIGGSIAAGIQAGAGPIVAGSLFATAQSVAAGGAIPLAGSALSGAVGAAGAYLMTPSMLKKDEGCEKPADDSEPQRPKCNPEETVPESSIPASGSGD